METVERVAEGIARRSRVVVALLLVLTLFVGAGAGMVEESSTMDAMSTDSDVIEKSDFVSANFSARGANTTTMLFAVRHAEGEALSKESLLRTLRFQRDLRERNDTLSGTLVADRPTVGVANLVAQAAIAERQRAGAGAERETDASADTSGAATPTIDEQIATLESMNASAVDGVVSGLLAADSRMPGSRTARQLMPRDYEAGSTTADARLIVVTHATDQPIRTGAAVSEEVVNAQVAARAIAQDQPGPESYLVFGRGIMTQQQNQAIDDSLSILGPVAMLFVLVALSIAYRDVLDVALGLVGVVVVLAWTFGVMGWLGVEFNQMMIAVPMLLIGLSVDYALHVVMRFRERRAETGEDVRSAMGRSLGAVGTALVLVTLTTAVGFLANLTSPVPDIQLFGAVTALGIACTLLVFGVFLPALKTEIECWLESRGHDRRKRAFGTGDRFGRFLRGGATLAKRAPLVVLAFALVVSAAGAAGAADIEAEYSPESFMADDPPGWTEHAPESMQPGEYFLADNREYVYSNFQSPDKQVHLLVEGDVTRDDTLERVAAAERAAASTNVTVTRATGEVPVESPLSTMRYAAVHDPALNATMHATDTDGDGVPDRNLSAVYDAFFAADPALADQYLHRGEDGEYAALRLRVPVVGTADHDRIRSELSGVAADIETGGTADSGDGASANASAGTTAGGAANATAGGATAGGALTATATGQPIVSTEITRGLVETVVEGLAATLVAVLLLLALVFRVSEGSATLGVVTLLPVLFTVAWLFGSMVVLDMPFTLITALMGSIALGLGVDYAIHVSERFGHELEEGRTPALALERTVTGTGGALLSSAVTTAAGFGVLTLSLLPALAQFGLILALGIVYAFLASVFVLPSLLALWARYWSPTAASDAHSAAAASDD